MFVTRTAWLMLGAAIGTAAVLVAASLGQLLVEITPVPWAAVATALLLVPLLGLVPGARELEVTAARTMLRVADDQLVPAHRLGRRRSIGWVVAHLVLGLLAGFLLLGVGSRRRGGGRQRPGRRRRRARPGLRPAARTAPPPPPSSC